MTQSAMAVRRWPRVRLHLRAVVSSTMVIGWGLTALTAMIPYFFLPKGQGSGGSEFLGMARATWLSLHVWLSFGMLALTLGHVLLNRAGVSRAFRVVSGRPRGRSAAWGDAARRPAWRPVAAWAAVAAVVVGLVVGGLTMAPGDEADGGLVGGRGRDSEAHLEVPTTVPSLTPLESGTG